MNNNLRAVYARKIMAAHPDLAGFFRTRARATRGERVSYDYDYDDDTNQQGGRDAVCSGMRFRGCLRRRRCGPVLQRLLARAAAREGCEERSGGVKYAEIVRQVDQEKRKTAYYSMHCLWWTTSRKDLGEMPGEGRFPCCPYCGSVLLMADVTPFLAAAEQNPAFYGDGGLETFAAAHHGSGLHARAKVTDPNRNPWDMLAPASIRFPRKARVLSTEKSVRCVRCGSEFSEAETEGANGCPKCGATGVPCAIKDDVTIRINWHELRILGMWADNYAAACDERDPTGDAKGTVAGILGRIAAQHPGRAPLTLMGELELIQESFPDAEATDGRGRKVLERKKPN